MQLPFSRDAFLDVFAAYNTSFWPVALAFWVATLLAFAVSVRLRRGSRWTFGLLAVQWTWCAVAYHGYLFSRINPAAWLFAAMFLLQAGLLAWYGVVRGPLSVGGGSIWRAVAYAVIAYGLLYPIVVVAGGHSYPRMPTFGVPCPLTLVTIGLLLLATPLPMPLTIVPFAWTLVGGSAAFVLGMGADLALLASGLALAARILVRPAPAA